MPWVVWNTSGGMLDSNAPSFLSHMSGVFSTLSFFELEVTVDADVVADLLFVVQHIVYRTPRPLPVHVGPYLHAVEATDDF